MKAEAEINKIVETVKKEIAELEKAKAEHVAKKERLETDLNTQPDLTVEDFHALKEQIRYLEDSVDFCNRKLKEKKSRPLMDAGDAQQIERDIRDAIEKDIAKDIEDAGVLIEKLAEIGRRNQADVDKAERLINTLHMEILKESVYIGAGLDRSLSIFASRQGQQFNNMKENHRNGKQ